MALLELLAGTAPTRVVAPDLLLLVEHPLLDLHFLVDLVERVRRGALNALGHAAGGRCRQRARLGLAAAAAVVGQPARGAAARAAADRPAGLRAGASAVGAAVLALDLDLDVEDEARELLPDRVDKPAEHLEAVVLVGDDRLDLREPAQVDALAQVVHVVQVLAPALVDDLEQDVALERAHELLAQLLLTLVVGLDDVVFELLDQSLAGQRVRVEVVLGQRDGVHLLELREQAAQVPVLDVVALQVLTGQALHRFGDLEPRGLRHVVALEDPVADLVDDLALLVHHVVVLEDALAHQEVLVLDLLLRVLDLLGEHLRVERLFQALLVHRSEPVEDAVDPVAGEQAHQVVLGGQEEQRLARVALTPGAAAQLVVDAARLVALGAQDEQAAELHDLLAVLLDLGLELGVDLVPHLVVLVAAGLEAELAQFDGGQVLGIAAELDVDAAARHVRGDRDRSQLTRLGDDLALALGVLGLGVQHRVLDALLLEPLGQHLRDLDRDRADEDRLARLVARLDLSDHGGPLAFLGLVDLVVAVVARDRAVGRDVDYLELVDLRELGRLGQRGAGHAGELLVLAEVVLVGDRRDRLVLLLDRDALLGLDRLVQALGPAPALQDAAGELVDDLHLAVDNGVVDVLLVERLGLQRLDQVVDQVAVLGEVHVLDAEELLGLLDAALGDRDGLVLLVGLVVEVGLVLLRLGLHALGLLARLEPRGQTGEAVIEVGRLLGLAGDDQRRAGLVDQDVVDLVDDREVVAALLGLLIGGLGQVVAQVVEAELGVRAVGDVRGVGGALDLGVVLP